MISDQRFRLELLSNWLDYYLSNAFWRLFTHNQVEVVVEVEAEVEAEVGVS